MTSQAIDAVILDQSLTDEQVYWAVLNSRLDTPERDRDGLTQAEWETKMEDFQREIDRQRTLLEQHRPRVIERIANEVTEQHRGCCGT